jgi:hypothetical protein
VAGYDTASTVNEVWQDAKSTYGTPIFWLRYFSPCPFYPFNDDPKSECQNIWDCNSSAPNLGPVTAPPDLTGNSAAGQADAKTFVTAVQSATYDIVGPLKLPTNGQLYCYLDQECSASMSSTYWDGWASYVNSYDGFDGYTLPLYAALYCSPKCSPPNCSSICSDCLAECYAIWTPEFQACGYDLDNAPPADFETCAAVGVDNGVATYVWQFAEQNVCGLSVNVDMDDSVNGFNTASHCFYLASYPS